MPQGVIPCLERHRDTTQPADFRRGSKSHSFPSRTGEREWLELNALLAAALPFAVIAVPGSGPPGQYVSPRRQLFGTRPHRLFALRDYKDLRWRRGQLWGRHG
jgi:hypothetical protein